MDRTVLCSVMVVVHAPVAADAPMRDCVYVTTRDWIPFLAVDSVLPGGTVRTALWRVMRRRTATDVGCVVRRTGGACVVVGLLAMRVMSVLMTATLWRLIALGAILECLAL